MLKEMVILVEFRSLSKKFNKLIKLLKT